MTTITNTDNNAEDIEQLGPSNTAGGNVKYAATLENRQLLKIDWLHEPEISLLGRYPRELKTYVHINIHTSIIHNCQKVETPKCPSKNG